MGVLIMEGFGVGLWFEIGCVVVEEMFFEIMDYLLGSYMVFIIVGMGGGIGIGVVFVIVCVVKE